MQKAIQHLCIMIPKVLKMLLRSAIFLLIFTNIVISALSAQNTLPKFTGVDLNGKSVNFPRCIENKKALVGFALSSKVQNDLQTWIEPVYYELIDSNSLASMVYDCDVYLIICFNKANSSMKKKVRRELEENVLIEFFPNIVLSDVNAGIIADQLNIDEKSVPHVYSLDENGRITHRTSGRYSERKFEKLSSYLEIE